MGQLATIVLVLGLFFAPPPQTVALKITVTMTAADGSTHPVPRQALLISDDPVTSSPRRYVTKADGTAEAYLKPGKYIVESDSPFIFAGHAYQWSQPVTVAASGETVLALTAANATIEAAKPGSTDSPAIAEAAAAFACGPAICCAVTWGDDGTSPVPSCEGWPCSAD